VSCSEFEALLIDYAELDEASRRSVDLHFGVCENCRAFRDALAEVDGALEREAASVRFSVRFPSAVLDHVPVDAAPRRPSFAPELLDLAGSVAVMAILAAVLFPLISQWDTSPIVLWCATGIAGLSIAVGAGVRALVDLNSDS